MTLGKDQGGYLGQALGGAVGVAIGATGSTILGVLLLLVGALLLSGASLGAILRRSGHQLHRHVSERRRRSAAAPIETVGRAGRRPPFRRSRSSTRSPRTRTSSPSPRASRPRRS